MASTGNLIGKKKLITRQQLTNILASSGKNPSSNLRRSPRSKQATTAHEGTSIEGASSVRRSLFCGKITSDRGQANASASLQKAHLETQTINAFGNGKANSVIPSNSFKKLPSQVDSCLNNCKPNSETGGNPQFPASILPNGGRLSKTPISNSVRSQGDNNVPSNEPLQNPTTGCSIEGLRRSPSHIHHKSNEAAADGTPNSLEHMEDEVSHDTTPTPRTEGGYNVTSRRRVRANMAKNEKGRGCNKRKTLTDPILVNVNEEHQPIGDSQRQMSSLIGCLARDPRKLPLDCFDWRLMEKEKKDALWLEVKRSFYFPEGKEPYEWVMGKLHECWRGYKSELKVEHFDGRSVDDAKKNNPKHIPSDMWNKLVEFWDSPKGKTRSERGIKNRANLKMCQYAGTKTFARVRAEQEAKGNKLDKLGMWLFTHDPKKGKLDDASAMAKQVIQHELAQFEEGTCDASARDEIFKKVVGEDKYGYAKTFGMGVKVPRSRSKRCALEEERAKRKKVEEEHEETKGRVQKLENLMTMLLKRQGLSEGLLSSMLEDDVADDEDNENVDDDEFDQDNAMDDVGDEE